MHSSSELSLTEFRGPPKHIAFCGFYKVSRVPTAVVVATAMAIATSVTGLVAAFLGFTLVEGCSEPQKVGNRIRDN